MPRYDYANCRECGRNRAEAGEMSWTRLCVDCSHRLLNENIDGLHEKTGPPFARWRVAMAACVGATIPSGLTDPQHGTR